MNLSLLLIKEFWLVDFLSFFNKSEILLDSFENLLHKLLNSLDLVVFKALVPLGKLSVVSLLRLGLELLHVLINMGSEDSVPVGLGLVGLLLGITVFGETWELLNRVRNVKTSVSGSLENTEDSVSDGWSDESDVKDAGEGSSVSDLGSRNIIVISIDLLVTLIGLVQLERSEDSSGKEQSSSIRSRVVGKTSSQTELLELLRGGLGKDLVSLKGGVDDLGDDLGIGEPGDKSVLRG